MNKLDQKMLLYRLWRVSQIVFTPRLLAALRQGACASMEHTAVLANLSIDYIVDVGANRGQFALAARSVFPRAKIHAFEPVAEACQIFKKVFAHDADVTLYPFAIGREETCSTLHITRDDDASSFLPITAVQTEIFPGTAEVETRQVMVYPLAQLIDPASIPSASLLKMDVQGYELEVLRGCEDLLQKFSHLYIECSFIEMYAGQPLAHQVIAWLAQRNFGLSGVHNLFYENNGMAIQGDFLFEKVTN